ncbi:hypothetical protein FOZ63_006722, partial [Perkinsus olseni]
EASIAESERYLQDRESRLSGEGTVRVDSLDVSPVGRSLTDERNSGGCSALQQLLAERDTRWPSRPPNERVYALGVHNRAMQQLIDERDQRASRPEAIDVNDRPEASRRTVHSPTRHEISPRPQRSSSERNQGNARAKRAVNPTEFSGKVDLWLRTYAREQQRRRAEKEERERAAQKCSFTPKISVRSRKMVEGTRPSTPQHTPLENP